MFFWRKKKTPPPLEQPVEELDPQEFIAKIPMHAEEQRKLASEHFGVELDYSAASIKALDEVIAKHWASPPVMIDQMVVLFGSYLGETIRRLHGGEWVFLDEFGYTLDNIGGRDVKIFPFGKVRKRFVNGEEDSLAFYYQVVAQQIEQDGEEPS